MFITANHTALTLFQQSLPTAAIQYLNDSILILYRKTDPASQCSLCDSARRSCYMCWSIHLAAILSDLSVIRYRDTEVRSTTEGIASYLSKVTNFSYPVFRASVRIAIIS